MKIVMPLFDFDYEGSEELAFAEGKYALRRFVADDEIPKIALLSELDIEHMRLKSWALIADNPDLNNYKEELNLLLIAFKITNDRAYA